MILILSKDISNHDKEIIRIYLKDRGFSVREQILGEDAIIGATGKGAVDIQELGLLPGVERVTASAKPYELASRETTQEDTIVTVGPVKIGGSRITVIAGPCAVESREQIRETAEMVRESGAVMLRGGAYKPRTSPYAFQGLGMRGLEYMKEAGEALNMPIVTEVVSPELADQMKDLTDMFQIGARNMQNFELLKKVGSLGKPVLLKRGPSATMEEWLMAAEYLLASGTKDVALCERGIRTFEAYTRNTLDISAIPVVKDLCHLPVIVDPSHAVGIRSKVPPAALAAIAAGADGLTVEVHPRPDSALSDGAQSLYPDQFERLMRDIEALAPVVGKELLRTPRFVHGSAASQEDGTKTKSRDPLSLASPQEDGTKKSRDPFSSAPPQEDGTKSRATLSQASPQEDGTKSRDPLSQASPQEDGTKKAFCGEEGAYAEQALMRVFGEEAETLMLPSFEAVFDAVLDGSAEAGIIPIENSLTGSIHSNYDLFLRYPDIAIAGEVKLRVTHCLIADERADIDSIHIVRSHPQGFAQCKEFLDKHPDWHLETCASTSSAVSSIAREGALKVAAIASESSAKRFGLKILKTGIEANPRNYTRFAIIAHRQDGARLSDGGRLLPELGGTPNKASLVFSVNDEPGSLFTCLKILSDKGINLSKLESRPIQGEPWKYLFYIDVSLPKDAAVFEAAIEELKAMTKNFYFLGIYRG